MAIYLVVFNGSLELTGSLGRKRLSHPAILADAKRRKKNPALLLLDMAVHHSSMTPEELTSKGRPDIIHNLMLQFHFSLLNTDCQEQENGLEAPNSQKLIRMFIHTPEDLVFEVPPGWRIPVSYLRFRGLIEELLRDGMLETPPIVIRRKSIEELLAEFSAKEVVLFTSTGNLMDWNQATVEIAETKAYQGSNIVWLIGGYQRGLAPPIIERIATKRLSIAPFTLPAWKVLATLITLTELALRRN